tara:strand:- start:2000 stop:2197 length:198 start_codon:yes stop_codon:yes gene_type:complete
MTLPRSVGEFVALALHKGIFWKQAIALADRWSEVELCLDKLALLPLKDLLGVAVFLKHKYAEMEA